MHGGKDGKTSRHPFSPGYAATPLLCVHNRLHAEYAIWTTDAVEKIVAAVPGVAFALLSSPAVKTIVPSCILFPLSISQQLAMIVVMQLVE